MSESDRKLKEVLIPLKSSKNSDRTILLVRDIEEIVAKILEHTKRTREDFMISGVHYRILLYILADHFLEKGDAGITKEEILRRSGYASVPPFIGILKIRRVNSVYHVLGWEEPTPK